MNLEHENTESTQAKQRKVTLHRPFSHLQVLSPVTFTDEQRVGKGM